jgi:hypothetical protein
MLHLSTAGANVNLPQVGVVGALSRCDQTLEVRAIAARAATQAQPSNLGCRGSMSAMGSRQTLAECRVWVKKTDIRARNSVAFAGEPENSASVSVAHALRLPLA